MTWTYFKRVLHFAVANLSRNKGMSFVAVFVLSVTVMLATFLFLVHGVSSFLITTIQDKIDVTAYFKEEVEEQDILNIKEEILDSVPEITNIQYVSKEDAFNNFNETHKDNPVFANALAELGINPFLASLNIRTNGSPSQYEQVSNILQQEQYSQSIEKIDFAEKKDVIEKVFSITSNITIFGLVLGGIMILIVALVVFNTIKLVIETTKDEINNMKIMGAPMWFIKTPFILQGALFGMIAFIICLLVSLIVVGFLSGAVLAVVPGFNLFEYFISSLWLILLIQIGFGVGLGTLSSLIVVNKHLKV